MFLLYSNIVIFHVQVEVHVEFTYLSVDSIRNNCASMNECFTDPIFRNFRVERKRVVKAGVQRRKEKALRDRLVIQ